MEGCVGWGLGALGMMAPTIRLPGTWSGGGSQQGTGRRVGVESNDDLVQARCLSRVVCPSFCSIRHMKACMVLLLQVLPGPSCACAAG
jgi:hypothetical protein